MRALVQRVLTASVVVKGETVGEIENGLCVLVGVTHSDTPAKAKKIAEKLWNLRIFDDESGQMNLSVSQTQGQVLVVSQFTLYGDTSNGRRPSFINAAKPEQAEPLIDLLIEELTRLGASVACGRFRTEMQVSLINDGPTTFMVEI